jgi:hypothetical protein
MLITSRDRGTPADTGSERPLISGDFTALRISAHFCAFVGDRFAPFGDAFEKLGMATARGHAEGCVPSRRAGGAAPLVYNNVLAR